MNYFLGLVNYEENEMKEIDDEVRRALTKNKYHSRQANKERLYLPNKKGGRNINSMVNKLERISIKTLDKIQTKGKSINRYKIIEKMITKENGYMANIRKTINMKYPEYKNENKEDEKPDIKEIIKAQENKLLARIDEKVNHGKYYKQRFIETNGVDGEASTLWQRKSNIAFQREGQFCKLQDRNLYEIINNNNGKCCKCGKDNSMDHIATMCGMLLHSKYVERHDEIQRCIHLAICRDKGLSNIKKIGKHRACETTIDKNRQIEIRTNVSIDLEAVIKHNKPDILIIDKRMREILIVEIGVTNMYKLKEVEEFKKQKYERLARELQGVYGYKTEVIPFVITWDGKVTKRNERARKRLGINDHVMGYIQTIALGKTQECLEECLNRKGWNDEVDGIKEEWDEEEKEITRIDE
jgi:hypothetical protein